MRFRDYLPLLAVGQMPPPPDPIHVLNNLIHTSELRSKFCLAMAAYYRTQWDAGKKDSVLLLTNLPSVRLRQRYGAMPLPERESNAIVMWYKSIKARDLADAEEQWQRRAQTYSLAQGGVVSGDHLRPASVPSPR